MNASDAVTAGVVALSIPVSLYAAGFLPRHRDTDPDSDTTPDTPAAIKKGHCPYCIGHVHILPGICRVIVPYGEGARIGCGCTGQPRPVEDEDRTRNRTPDRTPAVDIEQAPDRTRPVRTRQDRTPPVGKTPDTTRPTRARKDRTP